MQDDSSIDAANVRLRALWQVVQEVRQREDARMAARRVIEDELDQQDEADLRAREAARWRARPIRPNHAARERFRALSRLRRQATLSLAFIMERDGYRCRYCGTTTGVFVVDHIHPVSRGGTSDLANLALACRPCNLSKGAKTLDEWPGR